MWMLKQVPYVMRLCPYLYLVLPANKGLMFEIPLGLSALLKIVGTIIVQAKNSSRKGMVIYGCYYRVYSFVSSWSSCSGRVHHSVRCRLLPRLYARRRCIRIGYNRRRTASSYA